MLAVALLALVCCVHDTSAATNARPNILLILADDLGYSDLGCYGSEIATPNLDRLAANGLRFTQFYNTARCWPTRAALMTGYYPQQIRMDPPQGLLPSWARSLPQHLKPLGYRSYHSGKWHISGLPKSCADGGFDHSYRLEDHDRNFNPRNLIEDDEKLPPVTPGTGYYTATVFADHAIRCLKEHAAQHHSQPFFSYLAFTTPHFPLHAPATDIARYRDRYLAGWEAIRAERHRRQTQLGLPACSLAAPEPGLRAPSGPDGVEKQVDRAEIAYALPWEGLTPEQRRFQATKMAIHAAMVDRMDQEIGRVLAQIRDMGALENTLVLFLSDNGASAEILVRGDGHDPKVPAGSAGSFLCLGPGWSTVSNTPFRRHKIWVHEGGISTPLIVHWPAGIKNRGVWRQDVGHVIDLVPTLVELAGGRIGLAGGPELPGRSLAPAIFGNGAIAREGLYWNHAGNHAVRLGDWKLVSAEDDQGRWRLYNLAVDRIESTDLASEQPERVRSMAALWQQWEVRFRAQAAPQPEAK